MIQYRGSGFFQFNATTLLQVNAWAGSCLLFISSLLLVILQAENLLVSQLSASACLLLFFLLAGIQLGLHHCWFVDSELRKAEKQLIARLDQCFFASHLLSGIIFVSLLFQLSGNWLTNLIMILLTASLQLYCLIRSSILMQASTYFSDLVHQDSEQKLSNLKSSSRSLEPASEFQNSTPPPCPAEKCDTKSVDETSQDDSGNLVEDEEKSELIPENVTQQICRSFEGEKELISGQVRAYFASGQKHTSVHLGFCPPLTIKPQIELIQLAGPDVSIQVAVAELHGARIDLQRSSELSESTNIVLEFYTLLPAEHPQLQ